jgi:inhibitor of cysteine peptidase
MDKGVHSGYNRRDNGTVGGKGMKLKYFVLVIIAATLLTLFGCGSSSTPSSSTPKEVSVDSSYSAKEVEIASGGTLTVTLESNSSTGFQWSLISISDQAVLEKVDQKYVAPEAPQNGGTLVGAPGEEVWTFKALQKGKSTISMGYSRPWESVPPAKTFTLTVTVK